MTTDSVSDERLDQMICGFANVSALDRGARETTAALRELRSLRARHKEAVGLLDEIGNKTRAEDDKHGFKWLWFRPSLSGRLSAFLAGESHDA